MKRKLDLTTVEIRSHESGFSPSQQKAMEMVGRGENVFITGGAGTGKSFLIQKLVQVMRARGKFVLLAASTGVAAYHICGVTLHRFGGIGLGHGDFSTLYTNLARKTTRVKLWQQVDVLIIDEISMITTGYAKRLDRVARLVRKNQRPMGGIQVVAIGDFLQCPAITRPSDCDDFEDAEATVPLFESRLWLEQWRMQCVALRENFRQRADLEFATMLGRLRIARPMPQDVDTLRGRLLAQHTSVDTSDLIHLCSKRVEAEAINKLALAHLRGFTQVYKAVFTEYDLHGQPLKKKESQFTETKSKETRQPVDDELLLKVGAKVLLCYNLDVTRGLYNGARGTVLDFRRSTTLVNDTKLYPFVEFEGRGGTALVEPHRWENVENKLVVSTFVQVPLILRYAITIHKAQGMTLAKVLVTMDCFETGQAYVALSRVGALEDLYLANVDMKCIRASQNAVQFYTERKLLV